MGTDTRRPRHASVAAPRSRRADARPVAREEQQAALLGILRHARGAPVSYAHLHEHGIEFPASVAAELELQGIDVERCRLADAPHDADGSHRLGLRMAPGRDPDGTPPPDPAMPAAHEPPTGDARAAVRRRHLSAFTAKLRLRLLAPLALTGAIAAAIATLGGSAATPPPHAAGTHSPSAQHTRSNVAYPQRPRVAPRAGTATGGSAAGEKTRPRASSALGHAGARAVLHARAHTGVPSPHRHHTPVSGALAAQLESEGHSLIESGQPSRAVPILTRAVAATGEHVEACLAPTRETCLTFAYALYDLGHALQLSGHPGAAIPVLQERMQIDNQRPAVQAELDVAVAQARRGR